MQECIFSGEILHSTFRFAAELQNKCPPPQRKNRTLPAEPRGNNRQTKLQHARSRFFLSGGVPDPGCGVRQCLTPKPRLAESYTAGISRRNAVSIEWATPSSQSSIDKLRHIRIPTYTKSLLYCRCHTFLPPPSCYAVGTLLDKYGSFARNTAHGDSLPFPIPTPATHCFY